jgi:hypothetical protein
MKSFLVCLKVRYGEQAGKMNMAMGSSTQGTFSCAGHR